MACIIVPPPPPPPPSRPCAPTHALVVQVNDAIRCGYPESFLAVCSDREDLLRLRPFTAASDDYVEHEIDGEATGGTPTRAKKYPESVFSPDYSITPGQYAR